MPYAAGQVLSVVRDITQLRAAEEALRRQTALQDLLVDLSNRLINLPLSLIEALHSRGAPSRVLF